MNFLDSFIGLQSYNTLTHLILYQKNKTVESRGKLARLHRDSRCLVRLSRVVRSARPPTAPFGNAAHSGRCGISWQIPQEMKAQKLTKTALSKKMHTSRAALNRLLDEQDTSLTLATLSGVANALGKKLRIELA